MKKIVTACAAFAVALSPVVLASPASADTPGCVSRQEFRAVHKGMSKRKVHRIFDTRGTRQAFATSGGYTSEIRSYKTCARYSAVSVAYDNGKLSAKSAVWVS